MNQTEEKFRQLLTKKKELDKITCTCGATVFEDGITPDTTRMYHYQEFTCTKCGKKWWVRI